MVKLPEANDETIKDIEAIADILYKAKGGKFEEHLNRENGGEGQVADFNNTCESFRLVVVFDAHAEGVDEDAQENPLLENVVVHTESEAGAGRAETAGDSGPAGREAPGGGRGVEWRQATSTHLITGLFWVGVMTSRSEPR